ncbi:MAG: hypothetical protein H7243_10660 [Sphingomonadaceae bacterium]|nr:hypothetical protein [Sphingomonadaceae bacterium]
MPRTDHALLTSSERRQMALSTWDNEGGAGPCGAWGDTIVVPAPIPELTNTELVQMRIRVIALENLVIAMLAAAPENVIAMAGEMAAFISPRPGASLHPLTIHAATQMTDLVGRASRLR